MLVSYYLPGNSSAQPPGDRANGGTARAEAAQAIWGICAPPPPRPWGTVQTGGPPVRWLRRESGEIINVLTPISLMPWQQMGRCWKWQQFVPDEKFGVWRFGRQVFRQYSPKSSRKPFNIFSWWKSMGLELGLRQTTCQEPGYALTLAYKNKMNSWRLQSELYVEYAKFLA